MENAENTNDGDFEYFIVRIFLLTCTVSTDKMKKNIESPYMLEDWL